MCLEPVGAGAGVDLDRDGVGEGEGGLHGVDDLGDQCVGFGFVEVEDEFVVDLEDHLCPGTGLAEELVDFDHGELDHVGGGALDRGVDGGAFGVAAHVLVGGRDKNLGE